MPTAAPPTRLRGVEQRRYYAAAVMNNVPRLALLCAVFALLACAVTYPLVFSMDQLLGRITSPGEEIDVGDGIAFLGYVARASRALEAGGSVWAVSIENPNFTAPPAYLFPAAWLTRGVGNVMVAHNLLLLTYAFAAFACMFGFVYHLTRDTLASVYSAVLYGGCNYVIHHMSGGHANQSQIYLFPLVFLCLERLLGVPDWRRAVLLGGVLGLTAHSSSQYSVFMALLLPLYLVARDPSVLMSNPHRKALALSAAVALLGTSYYLAVKLGAGTIERSLWENQQYVVHSWREWVDPDAYAHVGLVPLGLALVACVGERGAPLGRPTRALAVMLVFCVVMALGPVSAWHPYRWFYDTVPIFSLMRTPIRFVAPAQMATAALAGIGLARLAAGFAGHQRARRVTLALVVAASAVSTPLLADRYTARSPEAGRVWVVEVGSHPSFQRVTRQ